MPERLQLHWVVFRDELDNLLVFDSLMERRVGVYDRPERRPTAMLVLTERELEAALEAVLDQYERTAASTPETRARIEAAERRLRPPRH